MSVMATTCPVCGGLVATRPRGRPGVYCSRSCQAKAYRARKAGGEHPRAGGPADAQALADTLWRDVLALVAAARGRSDAETATAAATAARQGLTDLIALARPAAGIDTADATAAPARRDETPAPVTQSPARDSAPAGRRPPRGLLSEPLWRMLAELHAAGPNGLAVGRHRGGWTYLAEGRRASADGPYVTDRSPHGHRDGGRRWLTEAGRAHLTAHADRYRQLYPAVEVRTPEQTATEPLTEADQWRVLVDIATGGLADPGAPVPQIYAAGGWDGMGHKERRVRLTVEQLRDHGLVTVIDGRRILTEAGRAHYTAHRADYARHWTDIHAPDIDAPKIETEPSSRDENRQAVTETSPEPGRTAAAAYPDADVLARRRWYTTADINDHQLVKAAGHESSGAYDVILARARIGQIRPVLGGTGPRTGWQALYRAMTASSSRT
jgi:hypothetical protein